MNEHDLLDAIGDIDPRYIIDADKTVAKKSKIAQFQRYYLAAAGLLLLIVSGVVIRNSYITNDYESIDETVETAAPQSQQVETEGAVADEEEAVMVESELPEIETDPAEETDGIEAIEESLSTSTSGYDYPAMLMHGGTLYKDTMEVYTGDIPDDGQLHVLAYVDGEPQVNGEQNFDRTISATYFVLDEETIVVCIEPDDGIWRLFKKQ